MFVRLIGILPTVLIGSCTRIFSLIKRPLFIKNVLIWLFITFFRINVSEIEKKPYEYSCLNDFFTRRLRSDVRIIDHSEDAVVSPVDGEVTEVGSVTAAAEFDVKGSRYSLEELVGDTDTAELFRGGDFAVFHLRPCDYHRVHVPVTSRAAAHVFIRGRLLPVTDSSLTAFNRVFKKNRRRATVLEHDTIGRYCMVKVGAFNVGVIPVEYEVGEDPYVFSSIDDPCAFEKGEEIARFEMGSTVILLFQKGRVDFQIQAGDAVQFGSKIGEFKF